MDLEGVKPNSTEVEDLKQPQTTKIMAGLEIVTHWWGLFLSIVVQNLKYYIVFYIFQLIRNIYWYNKKLSSENPSILGKFEQNHKKLWPLTKNGYKNKIFSRSFSGRLMHMLKTPHCFDDFSSFWDTIGYPSTRPDVYSLR